MDLIDLLIVTVGLWPQWLYYNSRYDFPELLAHEVSLLHIATISYLLYIFVDTLIAQAYCVIAVLIFSAALVSQYIWR